MFKIINDVVGYTLALIGALIVTLSGLIGVGIAVVSFSGSYAQFILTTLGVSSLSFMAGVVLSFIGYLLTEK